MTIEQKLKDLILERYNSIREFTQTIDMSYSTLDSILKRGVGNSSVTNVIKICKALGISADELADGKIVSVSNRIAETINELIEIDDILSDTKARLLHYDDLTLHGKPVDDDTVKAIVQGIEVSFEMAQRHNQNHNKNHNKITELTKIGDDVDVNS